MPEITAPFGTEKREESPGEAQQRLASLAQLVLRIVGIKLSEREREALATVLGAVLRAHPWLKEVGR